MLEEETRFAQSVVTALADELSVQPSAPVARVVLRWFEGERPAYFTVHVLFADERAAIPTTMPGIRSSGRTWNGNCGGRIG